jgi:hypothetical protein
MSEILLMLTYIPFPALLQFKMLYTHWYTAGALVATTYAQTMSLSLQGNRVEQKDWERKVK